MIWEEMMMIYNIDVDEFLKDEKIFRLVVGSLW